MSGAWELCSCPENYGSTCYAKRFYPNCSAIGLRGAGHSRFQREIGRGSIDTTRTKREHAIPLPFTLRKQPACPSDRQPDAADDDGLEAAVDQAIAACGGDMRSTIRALVVANEYLETEVAELMKAVSHAYVRGRFNTYSG